MTARVRKGAVSFLVIITTTAILLFGSTAVAQAPKVHDQQYITQELAIGSALSKQYVVGADTDVGPTPIGGRVMKLTHEDAKFYKEIQEIRTLRDYYSHEYNEKWGYFLYLLHTKYGFDPNLYRWWVDGDKIRFHGMH